MHCASLFLTDAVVLPALTATSTVEVVNEVRGCVIATETRLRKREYLDMI